MIKGTIYNILGDTGNIIILFLDVSDYILRSNLKGLENNEEKMCSFILVYPSN